MSQEVDAVVIVVSEETGRISVAIHGRLRRGVTVEALRATLSRELSTEAPKTKQARGKVQMASGTGESVSEVKHDGTGQAA